MREVGTVEAEELVSAEGLTVIDFYAIWCAPCRMLKPRLEALSEDYGDIQFFAMDVEKNEAYARRFGIRSIPTLLFFKGGQVVHTVTGMPSEKSLSEQLERHR